MRDGGEGGIRTPGTLARTPHFECGAIDHSATSPGRAAKGAFASPQVARRLSWGQAAGKAIDGKTAADQALADLARSRGRSSPPRYGPDRDDELSVGAKCSRRSQLPAQGRHQGEQPARGRQIDRDLLGQALRHQLGAFVVERPPLALDRLDLTRAG